MKRKSIAWICTGLVASIAIFLIGLSWHQSHSTEGTISEWWRDLGEVRSFKDFASVVSGEKARQRQQMRFVIHLDGFVFHEVVLLNVGDANKSDAPTFGGSPSRNMVNTIDKNVPTNWSVEEGKFKNVKWMVELGSRSYGGPVIANGVVYVGTNNARPRDKKIQGKDKAVLMAFKESNGDFLWQVVRDIPNDPIFAEGREEGLCSTPAVDGKHIYFVAPGCELVCVDTDGKVQWVYDFMKELKVVPFHLSNCSPLVVGDHVLLLTSNGRDNQGNLASPKAPSFIAVNKKTGKLAWQSNLPGDRIIEGQWANPGLAMVNGKPQAIFPGGDGVVYSFEPDTGKLIWKCDCNPVRIKGPTNYFVATPVNVGDRIYIGMGVAPDVGTPPRFSYFLCLDPTKEGDVSFKAYDAKDPANKGSALVWAFGGMVNPPPAKGRKVNFGYTMSTAAVHDGLIYIPEETGYLHCLDAKTGERYWDHDFKSAVWGSAYAVDGKVYVNTDDGEVVIFQQGKKAKILATISMEESGMHSTPVVANGMLYIATKSKLYAIGGGK